MTPRKKAPRTWPWSCECGASGVATSAYAKGRAEALREEREACAQMCEDADDRGLAAAIRAREEKS